MANTKSARKMIRVSAHKRQRNAPVRVAVKTEIKKANAAIAAKSSGASESVVSAISSLDQAAQHGVLHKNNAARRKSRLMRRLNQMSATS